MKTMLILLFLFTLIAGAVYANADDNSFDNGDGGYPFADRQQPQQPDQTPQTQMPYSPALNPGIDANGYAR